MYAAIVAFAQPARSRRIASDAPAQIDICVSRTRDGSKPLNHTYIGKSYCSSPPFVFTDTPLCKNVAFCPFARLKSTFPLRPSFGGPSARELSLPKRVSPEGRSELTEAIQGEIQPPKLTFTILQMTLSHHERRQTMKTRVVLLSVYYWLSHLISYLRSITSCEALSSLLREKSV